MSTATRVLAEASATRSDVVKVSAFASASFEARTPPKEIQLWNPGDNATDYGVHRWTARSLAEVVGRYELRGNPLLIDVEHNGAKSDEDGEPSITGGYARLEIRAGAPWLVFEWSAYADEQIRTGQRRFLSPEYDVDRNTGEILALYRVSLVADPGTHRARMLAAAPHQEIRMDIAMILAALRAALAAEDPAVAKESIANLVAELGKSAGAAPAEGEQAAAPGGDPGAAGDPQATAADDPPGSSDDGKEKQQAASTPVAAGAPAKPAKAPPAVAVAAAAAAAPTAEVQSIAAAAKRQILDAQRDHLLLTQGDRLEPSVRRWASAQPFEVVKTFLDSLPAKLEAPGRVAATRGETQGQDPKPKGLEGGELEELNRSMGIVKACAAEPHTTAAGVLVLPAVPPSVYRERKRAAAAAAIAGKAGK